MAETGLSAQPVVGGEAIHAVSQSARTDSEGAVEFEAVLPGLEYSVRGDSHLGRTSRRMRTSAQGQSSTEFRLVLLPE